MMARWLSAETYHQSTFLKIKYLCKLINVLTAYHKAQHVDNFHAKLSR